MTRYNTPAEHQALCSNPLGITSAASGLVPPRHHAASASIPSTGDLDDDDAADVHELGAASDSSSASSSSTTSVGQYDRSAPTVWRAAGQSGAFRRPPGT